MNKETFIKELMKKLTVLSEEEKLDIKLEYQDIIEEKIKHGKTEIDAVKEFGDIDKLAKDILSAYKINPNYRKDSTKNFIDDCENAIKKGAEKLSKVTEDVASNIKNSNNDINLEFIIELVIKIFLVLIALAFLRIPFMLIEEIGHGIFNSSIIFFGGDTLGFVWRIIIEAIYIAICILVVVVLISKITNNKDTNTKKKKDTMKKETNSINENIETEKKVVSTEKEMNTKNKKIETEEKATPIKKENQAQRCNNTLSEVVLLLVKMWIIIIFLIPIWCTTFGLIIAESCLIFFAIKGILVIGPILCVLGFIILCCYLSDLVFSGLFKNKKIRLYPLLISLVFIIIGGFMTIDYMTSFTYKNYLPENNFEVKTKIFNKKITSKISSMNESSKLVIDNKLKDGVLRIEVSYYKDFIEDTSVNYFENESCGDIELCNYLNFEKMYNDNEFSFNKKISDLVIENIKDHEIYNYSEFSNLKITIYANQKTSKLVK